MDNNFFEGLTLERVNKDKLRISWNKDNYKKVELYWNINPILDGNECLITSLNNNELIFSDPNLHKRSYFILKYNTTYKILGETILPLETIYNFRDLGGIKINNNKRIRWGIFYRSAQITNPSTEDLEYINSLGLKTILDYRSKGEVNKNPDIKIEGAKYFNISAMPTLDKIENNMDLFSFLKYNDDIKKIGDPVDFLCEAYRKMAFNSKAYRELMLSLQDTSTIPLVQHCTSGKDRTGVGSALILLALGVKEEDVIKDYMKSNKYIKVINEKLKKSLSEVGSGEDVETVFDLLMEVRPIYMESLLDGIKEKYTTIDNYFEKEYRLTKEKRQMLQDIYSYDEDLYKTEMFNI